ncbi:uncharacterized protein LOC115769350 [Drosophila novamexicana]|uniref:Prefoldin subunit 4 n=1 Tax=Drosophila virilis TaxID=7244 RepID=B4LC24_DROVI|nr:uncharacterized protein LOC6624471 [Drosophila virilis]XP_030569984.1 uncharacterized protein LOC115769350 [Drosophila novamexicana]EDW70852.1 uncharacterized protein Dvir_GJ11317 [Drosophila virilis]
MALAQQYSNISEEVMEYLFDQKIRERDLIAEKEELKLRMNKIEEHLVLLQNRDDELTCMIAAGNLYQLSTVKLVREGLLASLTASMQPYLKLHRKLLRLQRHIREDHSVLYENLIRTPST